MKTKSSAGNIIKIAGVYTAIILGAGFASGQELMQFFVRHGTGGIFGLIFSGVIFSILGWFVLDISSRKRLDSFHDLAVYIAGKRLGSILETLAGIFLLVLYATMLAAGGAVAVQAFDLHYSSGVVILGILCFITFLFDLGGLVKINSLIAPFMVVGGIFVGLYAYFTQTSQTFGIGSLLDNWASSAVIYASYNIVTAISVLVSIRGMADKKNTAKWAGILGGCCMTMLGLSLSLPIFLNYTMVIDIEIPILAIIERYGTAIKSVYLFVLVAAIFTTAIANGFAVIQWIGEKTKASPMMIKVLLTIAGILAAHIGFSNFVGQIYPMFGYLGLVEIALIVVGWVRMKTE